MLPALSTILVGITASVLALQAAPPPTGVPATTPPPKERIRPPNEIYKPSKQDSRNPDQWEQPAQPKKPADKDAPPAGQPGQPAQPAGQPAGQPAAQPIPGSPDAADGDSTSAAPANAAGTTPVVVVAAPPKPLAAANSQDITVVLVVGGCIFLPLILGMWWVFKDGVRDTSRDIHHS